MEPSTCKNAPIKDTSGLAYDNCATVSSNHTMDTGQLNFTVHPFFVPNDAAVCGAWRVAHAEFILLAHI